MLLAENKVVEVGGGGVARQLEHQHEAVGAETRSRRGFGGLTNQFLLVVGKAGSNF